jgi:nucleotide-binding universal stress UspA family protein
VGKENGMFEHILVATDASDPSRRAIVLAGEIAGDHASEVVVLHAIPRVVSPSGTLDLEEPESAREVVEASVRELKDGGVSARGEIIRVLEGHLARGIVESAASMHADVIVMGARGRSDFGGLFPGGVTQRVLHLAEGPVIVVP